MQDHSDRIGELLSVKRTRCSPACGEGAGAPHAAPSCALAHYVHTIGKIDYGSSNPREPQHRESHAFEIPLRSFIKLESNRPAFLADHHLVSDPLPCPDQPIGGHAARQFHAQRAFYVMRSFFRPLADSGERWTASQRIRPRTGQKRRTMNERKTREHES